MSGIHSPRSTAHVALPILIALVATAALPAQASKLEREVDFIRALARDMRFIPLAQLEASRLQQSYRAATDQDRIAQLGIEISLIGAKTNADRATQRARFKEALEQSMQLLERSSDETVTREARATMADAAQEFGMFLIEELEIARTDKPDDVKSIEEDAAAVFKAGVEACDKVMADIESTLARMEDPNKKAPLRLQHGLMWLRKGVLQRENGRAVKADRGFLVDRAKSTLEDLALEWGEETALGLRAMFEIAISDEVIGRTKDAIDFFKSTIAQIETSLDTASELSLNADTQAFLFTMMQEVYDHLARVLFEQGQSAEALKLFEQFRGHLTKYGEKGTTPMEIAHPQFGHSVFLTEARFLAESGDPKKVTQSLATAQLINDKHPSDYVGVRAKAVIRDILTAQQRLVSGKLLFEVAKGEFQNKNYEPAVVGLRKALAVMSREERNELGLESYDMMARAYALTDRWLEAVLAFREGLSQFGQVAKGDAAASAVDFMDRAAQRLKQNTKNDPAFEALHQDVARLVLEFGGAATANKVNWKEGSQLMVESRFAEAAAKFAAVTNADDFLYYELARVRIAAARQRAGDFAGARKALAEYRAWLETTAAVLDARRTDKQQLRAQARGEMAFRDASMAYDEAVGSVESLAKKDLTKYPGAIEKLRVFLSNHGKDVESAVPFAYDYLGRLHTELGEMPQAEEAYVALRERDSSQASKLATVIFDQFLGQAESLKTEVDKAINEGKTAPEIDRIRVQLKEVRQRLVGLGQQYIRTSPDPQYAIFSHTARQFEALGEWPKVEEVASKAIELFAGNATYKENLDRVLRPMVGESLLNQRKFQLAYDMLIEAEKANPNLYDLKRLISKTLGGWFEFDDRGRSVIVPGLDRPTEAYEKYWNEYGVWVKRPDVQKYSLEWYRFHWEAYWFARAAGDKDDSYKRHASSLYGIAKSIDNFETLKKHGEDGTKLFQYFTLNRPK